MNPNVRTIAEQVLVADILVIKALESVGKRLLNERRSRYKALSGVPRYLAHTRFQVTEYSLSRALNSYWTDVESALERHGTYPLNTETFLQVLKDFVTDIAMEQKTPTIEELTQRLMTAYNSQPDQSTKGESSAGN